MSALVTTTTADELAPQIKEEHDTCVRRFAEAVDHAFKAGDLLIKAKGLVPRGEWLDWLAEHTGISERVAQVYMQMAKNIPIENRSTRFGSSIRQILETIQTPRLAPPSESETDSGDDDANEAAGDSDFDNESGGDSGDMNDDTEPGRTPEQKVDDVVADTVAEFSQHCHWKGVAGVDLIAALEKLAEWVKSELKRVTTDALQSAKTVTVATVKTIAAPGAEEKPKGKGGRPKGSKNKPKVTTAPEQQGNGVDPEQSAKDRGSHYDLPEDGSIPDFMRRTKEAATA
jgi:hypothetical protein